MNRLNFFESHESLTTLEWILRSLVSFAFLLLIAKSMGQRSISQLRFLDFVIALVLGNIIAHPLSDERLGLKGSMITTSVLVILYVTATWLSLKSSFFRRYVDPPPIELIKSGEIMYQNLSRAKISLDFLFSELRKGEVNDIQKVALAIWEPGGTISIFMNSQYQPITPADLNIATQPFTLIKPIIQEGKINNSLLKVIGKDQLWLQGKIGPVTKISDVVLATIDDNENIRVYLNPRNKSEHE